MEQKPFTREEALEEEAWRVVDRAARQAFIERYQGIVDPEVLIV